MPTAATERVCPEDCAKTFRSVVIAADIWYAAGREIDMLPDGLSISGVCLLAADYVDDMPGDVCSLLAELAGKLRLPPPAGKPYKDGARCLLHIQRALQAQS